MLTWVLVLHFYAASGGTTFTALPMSSHQECMDTGAYYQLKRKNLAHFECIRVRVQT